MRRALIILLMLLAPLAARGQGALVPWAPMQFTNGLGVLIAGGKLCSYIEGTTTPQKTYSTPALSALAENTNPIILGSNGRPQTNGIYLSAALAGAGRYKFVLRSAGTTTDCTTGTVQWTADGIYDLAQLFTLNFATKIDDKVCHASQMSGTTPDDLGGKIHACWLLLPSTGGTVDARGLEGAQVWSSDMWAGGITKKGTLILGASTISCAATQVVPAGVEIEGVGYATTINVPGGICFSLSGNSFSLVGVTMNLLSCGGTTSGVKFNAAIEDVYIYKNIFTGTSASADCYALTHGGFNLVRLTVRDNKFTDISYALIEANSDTSVSHRWVFDNNYLLRTTAGFNLNHPSSTGSLSDVEIVNNKCDGSLVTGWCFGVSGRTVSNVLISGNSMTNCVVECIHIEDGAYKIRVTANDFSKGTAVTAIADRAMLYCITGSHGILSTSNVYDLTGNSGSQAFGFGTVAGGGTAPYDTESNGDFFYTKSGTVAVVVSEGTSATISNGHFENPNVADKAAYFVDGTAKQGFTGTTNTFANPAGLVNVNNNSFGVLESSEIVGDLASFDFLTGNTVVNTSVTFKDFSITRPFTADNVVTTNTLFPAGQSFSLQLVIKLVQNGVNVSWISRARAQWNGTNFSLADVVKTCGGSSTCGPVLTYSGGNILGASQNAGAVTGTVKIIAIGTYTPS